MNVPVRVAFSHAASAIAGGVATVGFMSSHGVDLYAIWDQLNVVFADVTKLIAMATPLATGAYAVYKSTTKQRLQDLSKNPDIKGIVTTQAIAASITSDKVQATAAELPQGAK